MNRSLDFFAREQYDSASISLHDAKAFFSINVLSRAQDHYDVTTLNNVIHKLISSLVESQAGDSVDINVFRFSAATLISDIIWQLIRFGFIETSQNCCLELCELLANPSPARESDRTS